MQDYRSDPLAVNRKMIEDFRAARARGERLSRLMLLLTTTGARSGRPQTVPVMYVPHGDRLLVIGSNAGSEKEPAWVGNLRANPEARIELGAGDAEVRAEMASGGERDRLFAYIGERFPFFLEYQAGTKRTIPVIVLTAADGRGFEV